MTTSTTTTRAQRKRRASREKNAAQTSDAINANATTPAVCITLFWRIVSLLSATSYQMIVTPMTARAHKTIRGHSLTLVRTHSPLVWRRSSFDDIARSVTQGEKEHKNSCYNGVWSPLP